MWHEGIALAPCTHQGSRSRQIVGKRVLARDEKLDSIGCELSMHTRKASLRPSWDAHSSNRVTQSLEGAWGTTLEAKWDQCGGSLPYIGMEALGNRSPN